MAVPSNALRSASAGDSGAALGAARGGSAFGKNSQLTQAMKIAKQAPLANATAKCSAATQGLHPDHRDGCHADDDEQRGELRGSLRERMQREEYDECAQAEENVRRAAKCVGEQQPEERRRADDQAEAQRDLERRTHGNVGQHHAGQHGRKKGRRPLHEFRDDERERHAEGKAQHRMSVCGIHGVSRCSSTRTRCAATRGRSDSAATHSDS